MCHALAICFIKYLDQSHNENVICGPFGYTPKLFSISENKCCLLENEKEKNVFKVPNSRSSIRWEEFATEQKQFLKWKTLLKFNIKKVFIFKKKQVY